MVLAKIIAFFLLISAFSIRPTYFGEDYSTVGSAFILCLGCFSLLVFKIPLVAFQRNAILFTVISLYWLWLAVHSLALGADKPYALYSFVLITSSTAGAAFAFAHKDIHDSFFRFLVYALSLMGVSWLITVILSLYYPLYALKLTTLPISTYVDRKLYFPFTIEYSTVYNQFTGHIPRLAAGFREAGIAQAFYVWAILVLPYLDVKKKPFILFGLLAGLLGTQSTVALFIFAVTFLVKWVFVSKGNFIKKIMLIMFGGLFMIIMFYFAYYAEGFGLQAKMQTTSFTDRLFAMLNGIQSLLDNPIGIGIYNSETKHAGINLIAIFGQIGFLGLLGFIIVYTSAVCVDRQKIDKFCLLLPFLITSIMSQPLLEAGLIYIMMLQYIYPRDVPQQLNKPGRYPYPVKAKYAYRVKTAY